MDWSRFSLLFLPWHAFNIKRYWCSALPTELSSQLGAGHVVSSLYTRTMWRIQVNLWKLIYLNCGEWWRLIIASMHTTFTVSSWEMKAWKKKFRPERDSNPWISIYSLVMVPLIAGFFLSCALFSAVFGASFVFAHNDLSPYHFPLWVILDLCRSLKGFRLRFSLK